MSVYDRIYSDHIQYRMFMPVYDCINDRSRPFKTVHTTVHEVHSTSVHIRFDTLAIRPINTVQVRIIRGQIRSVRSSTGIHGLKTT